MAMIGPFILFLIVWSVYRGTLIPMDVKNKMVIDGRADWIFNGDHVIFQLKTNE